MKTAKFLGVTTLAGALLFTGATAHHNNEAHADENYKLVLPTPDEWQKRHDEQVATKAKAENPNQAGEGGGPGAITTNVNSYREYVDNNLKYGEKVGFMDVIVPKEGQEFLNNETSTANNTQAQNTNNNNATANNTQAQNTNNNNATANNTQAQNTNNSNATANNTQGQNTNNSNATVNNMQAQKLPETGQETSNSYLVTMIASILLATGSLLTFKRFSKSNK
ncbi:MAG: LPXTG cell wall anchor domain-containing protein [Rickettsia endosymbiont of Ixodes persulcatus]|nr:LPXTG cell wall anchor domain-containing protein [Rickettsia endosymbiont of Ixodes persulcatus]